MKRLLVYCFVAILLICAGTNKVSAQELLCTIEVNSSQVEGTNKSVFETLQEAMNEYVNTRK